MVTDDGGELIPMFNNFNEGVADSVKGFVQTPNLQLSGYRAPCKVWLES